MKKQMKKSKYGGEMAGFTSKGLPLD